MCEVTPIILLKESVNDDKFLVIELPVKDGQHVCRGDIIAVVETSKAVHEVESPTDGYVHFLCAEGDEVPVGEPLAFISEEASLPPEYADAWRRNAVAPSAVRAQPGTALAPPPRFSKAALDLAAKHGLDTAMFQGRSMVRKADVEAALSLAGEAQVAQSREPRMSRTDSPAGGSQLPPATIDDTEVRFLTSARTGQRYRISVCVPPECTHPNRVFPAVYALGLGGTALGLVAALARFLHLGQELPSMIIVAIGYDTDDIKLRQACRRKDFTPTAVDGDPHSGGAAPFLEFLRHELIPLVDANYRTDPGNRTIMGHSYGALFALYAMFHPPHLFQRYIASGPSLWWDNGVVFEHEKWFAGKHHSLPARLFLSVGSAEPPHKMLTPVKRMISALKARCYEGLEMHVRVYEG